VVQIRKGFNANQDLGFADTIEVESFIFFLSYNVFLLYLKIEVSLLVKCSETYTGTYLVL
jgi:hypothetical protein